MLNLDSVACPVHRERIRRAKEFYDNFPDLVDGAVERFLFHVRMARARNELALRALADDQMSLLEHGEDVAGVERGKPVPYPARGGKRAREAYEWLCAQPVGECRSVSEAVEAWGCEKYEAAYRLERACDLGVAVKYRAKEYVAGSGDSRINVYEVKRDGVGNG